MDQGVLISRGRDFLKKYRFAVLFLLIGLLLMAIPEKSTTETPTVQAEPVQTSEDLEESLSQILSRIQGAGKVEVLLTESRGKETLYQTNDQTSQDSSREDTVLISGTERQEEGLVRQVNPPVYQGAIVVCQGGDKPTVKLAIVEAVMSVTGLSSNAITVLKMK